MTSRILRIPLTALLVMALVYAVEYGYFHELLIGAALWPSLLVLGGMAAIWAGLE